MSLNKKRNEDHLLVKYSFVDSTRISTLAFHNKFQGLFNRQVLRKGCASLFKGFHFQKVGNNDQVCGDDIIDFQLT